MIRVDTNDLLAKVMEFRLGWITIGRPVRKAMSPQRPPGTITIEVFKPPGTIPITRLPRQPIPASIRLDLYLALESVDRPLFCLHVPPTKKTGPKCSPREPVVFKYGLGKANIYLVRLMSFYVNSDLSLRMRAIR